MEVDIIPTRAQHTFEKMKELERIVVEQQEYVDSLRSTARNASGTGFDVTHPSYRTYRKERVALSALKVQLALLRRQFAKKMQGEK